jgi:hypothetical protein
MTTVLSPIEFDHLVQVVHHKACGHRAECWCGWASAWCDDYATADEAANHHRETAAGPATGLHATLGGLLDLQDDLADTVLWLVENGPRTCPSRKRSPEAPASTTARSSLVFDCWSAPNRPTNLWISPTCSQHLSCSKPSPTLTGAVTSGRHACSGGSTSRRTPRSRQGCPRWLSRRDEFRRWGKLGL